MPEALSLIPVQYKLDVTTYFYTPSTWKVRSEDQKFKVILSYTMSSRSARAT